jgi:hypothetical protein
VGLLDERDHAVLLSLLEHKVLTTDQIKSLYFRSISPVGSVRLTQSIESSPTRRGAWSFLAPGRLARSRLRVRFVNRCQATHYDWDPVGEEIEYTFWPDSGHVPSSGGL